MNKFTILAGTAFIMGIMATANAFAVDAPKKYRLCTGKSNGGYNIAGEIVKNNARIQGLDIEVVTDTGGSWANILRSVTLPQSDPNSCDAFISQSSGILRLARQAKAKLLDIQYAGYAVTEVPQVVCSRSEKIADLSQLGSLKKKTLSVGGQDSGSAITVEDFRVVDDEMKKVTTLNVSQVASLQDGTAQCGIFVGVIGDPEVQSFNDNQSKDFIMVDVVNKLYKDVVNPMNQAKVYRIVSIPKAAYPKLLSHNWNYWDTLVTDSGFYVVKSKFNPSDSVKFTNAVSNSKSEIQSMLVPDYLK